MHKLPESMTLEEGALVEPATVALHAVHRSELKAGQTAAIFGAGPIGLLVLLAAIKLYHGLNYPWVLDL